MVINVKAFYNTEILSDNIGMWEWATIVVGVVSLISAQKRTHRAPLHIISFKSFMISAIVFLINER